MLEPRLTPELPVPLAVVCHDAGACNIILPWLQRRSFQLRAVMQGPARHLWRARFGEQAPLLDSLDEALAGARFLLSGTGWASPLEHQARVLAARQGVRSAAVIDHWVNYRERFERAGQTQWPDEFWVTDGHAEQLARWHFPSARVQRYSNLYLAEQVQRVQPLAEADQGVLYVMEPMRQDWGRGVAGEWQALDSFMQHRVAAGIPPSASIRLRPHPSDEGGKYAAWLARHPAVQLDHRASLADALQGARWVVGCESYALVVALAAGRTVFCSLPSWAPACRLPQAGIRRLLPASAVLA